MVNNKMIKDPTPVTQVNPYYASQYDDEHNVDADSIAATAQTLARALAAMATDDDNAASSLTVCDCGYGYSC